MDKSKPMLSVIIVSTNHGRYLPGLFACLRAQGADHGETEIIFVDNGSVDDSRKLARVWGDGLACTWFRTVRLSSPHPKERARSAGLAVARGEYLLCLDGDCLLTGSYLRECMTGLHRSGKDIVLTGFTRLHGGEAGGESSPDRGSAGGIGLQVILMRRSALEKSVHRSAVSSAEPDPLPRADGRGWACLRLDKPLYFSRSCEGRRLTPVPAEASA
jgi:glycosyltransferase involved in cell wall biosynthesis